MKIAFVFLALFPVIASGATVELGTFDQEKLADLLLKIDKKLKKTTKTKTGRENSSIKNIFPIDDSPLKISCESTFYNGSAYPSQSICEVTLDVDESGVSRRFDEYELLMDGPNAEALFRAISYGKPVKVLRSNEMHSGVSFEGFERNIFHYTFKCTEDECTLRFSRRIVKG